MRFPYWVAMAVLCGVLASPNWAAAQATAGTDNSQPAATDVDEELVRAVAAYEAADYATAGALFEAVHHRAPTARTLRGLALVAYKQRHFAAAVELFEASLAHPVKPLEGRLRDDALRLLQRARDELPVQAEGAPLPAELTTPSRGETAQPEVPATSAATPTVVPPSGMIAETAVPAPGRRPVQLKRAGYSLLALGATTLLLAGTSWAIGTQRLSSIEEACRDTGSGTCTPAEAEERQRAARLTLLSRLTTAGLVIGLASAGAAVTTLTLYYTGPRHGSTNAGAWGVSLRGRF